MLSKETAFRITRKAVAPVLRTLAWYRYDSIILFGICQYSKCKFGGGIMNKVITYIDGLNLYYGLCDAGWRKYLWLNVQKMAESLLMINQELVMTKYFTAIVINDTEKQARQTRYLEALETLNYFKVFKGEFLPEPRECPNCKCIENIPKEKMTDVNIAVEMLSDAYCNSFDIALLISADTDFVPVVEAIRNNFDKKRIIICFPPKRFSDHLKDIAHAYYHIGKSHFARSLLPPKVTRDDGYILECPATWA